ncbi:MAG TPA: DnaJ C-terminal domain-containing protein [Variovorax sp.]|nr:DnaJ C-terminal domain-containing protein [Variovorax sp.]
MRFQDLVTDNAFAELGLPSDATEREVKAAWRRLASQWHPDRNASAEASARMQRINQAFEYIRRHGCALPTPPDEPMSGSSPPQAANAPEDAPASDAASASGGDASPDADPATGTGASRRLLRRRIKLTLEEAAAGCIKVLRGKVVDACVDCAGVGSRVMAGRCAPCGGSGVLQKRSFFGWSTAASTACETCMGSGAGRVTCAKCEGAGRLPPRNYRMNVRIPQGVRNGDLLHVDGRRPRDDSPNSDIEIRVEVAAHDFFRLDDDGTIRCDMPIDGFAWIANRVVKVPTVSGLQTLQLDRERLSYRLEGQGFPVERRGSRGDQVVTLTPVFPSRLSSDQQILLDQLSATGLGVGGEPVDERLRTWHRGLRAWEKGRATGSR